MTVEYMLNNISSQELTEWIAFSNIENAPPPKVKASDMLKAQFGHLVKKKGN